MGEERPSIVISSPFGDLKVGTQAHSYPHQVDLDVKGQEPVDFDGQQFDSFTAEFSLKEGALRARTIYFYGRHSGGVGVSGFAVPAATRKKFQAEVKKALLANRLELVQLEMEVLEQLETRLVTKKQTLVNLGATPRPTDPEEPSALGTLLNL